MTETDGAIATTDPGKKRRRIPIALARGIIPFTLYLFLLTASAWLIARQAESGYGIVFKWGQPWQWHVGLGSLAYWLLAGLFVAGLQLYKRGTEGSLKIFPDAEPNRGVPHVATGLRRRARFLNGASYCVLVCILSILWYGYGVFSQAEQRTKDDVLSRSERLIERYTGALAAAEGLKLQLGSTDKASAPPPSSSIQKTYTVPSSTVCEQSALVTVDSSTAKASSASVPRTKNVDQICAQQEFVRQTELAVAYKALANTGAPLARNGKDLKDANAKVNDLNYESIALGMTTKLGSVAILFFTIVLLVRLYQYTSRLSVFYHSRADLLHLFKPSDVVALEKFAEIYAPDWVEFGKGAEGLYEKLYQELLPNKAPSRWRFSRPGKSEEKG